MPCCPLLPGSPADTNLAGCDYSLQDLYIQALGIKESPLLKWGNLPLIHSCWWHNTTRTKTPFLGSMVLALCISRPFGEHHVQPSVAWESFNITSNSGFRSHPVAKTPLHPLLSAVAGLSWASHPRYKHYKPFWALLPQVLWGHTLHKGWSLLGLSSLLSAQQLKQIETRTEEKCQKTVNL